MMKGKLNRIGLVFALVAVLSTASLANFTGSLTTADNGLVGTGLWAKAGDGLDVTFSWHVWLDPDQPLWHYDYTFNSSGLQGTLSHLIVETSTTFTANNIYSTDPDPEAGDPKLQTVDSGNTGMPEDVFGLRFPGSDSAVYTVHLVTARDPVWGDIFAKDGNAGGCGENALWNVGFTASDSDPIAGPSGGSCEGHVLVPDSVTVPLPGAVVLGSLGLGFAGWLRKRQDA